MNQVKLVLAEKPSVAKAISDVLGANSKKNGCYEGNGYIISWCVGHLLGLAQPQDYDEKYQKWRYEDLPIAPARWKYLAAESTKKQLKILVDLMKRSDVGEVINACDAGREGELIMRLVYNHAGCTKPLMRLWVSSLEPSAIRSGFDNLRSGTDYDRLYHAADCRQKADWLVGLNYTRLFSVLYNAQLRVGRVQTPTLAMIVEREQKINGFVKEPFFVAGITDGNFSAEREKVKDKHTADAIRAGCDGKTAVVKSVQRQEKSVSAPKLYDLTTLQREANRLFGYTAAGTLSAVQSLYEQKVVTYPRTDSRYITEDMAAGIPALVQSMAALLPFSVTVENANVQQIVDGSRVTDHHAIIPTPTASKADLSALPTTERNILNMICTRLVSAVSERHTYAETAVTLECAGEIFAVKGKTVIQNGWKAVEQAFLSSTGKSKKDDDKTLPELYEGQQFSVAASVRNGFSQPPKHYTEDLLLSSMETAGAEDMPDDVQGKNFPVTERKGLGTPATRAAIIENLVKSGLLTRKDKQLLPTEKGINLIKILPDSVKSPMLTAEWENHLKRIEKGELSPEDFMRSIDSYVADTVKSYHSVSDEQKALFGAGQESGESVGKCPRCSGNIFENSKAFSCDKKCGFALFKDSKFWSAKKKKLTKDIAAALLTKGRVFLSGLHSEKSGKSYSATIILEDSGTGYPNFRMEFDNKK